MRAVDELCELLQCHATRDKVVYLTCYTLKLWGSTARSEPLLAASARLAAARATMRLFDDATALNTLIRYGLGKQDGPLWGAVGVSNSIFTLAYLQAEKIAWLIDSGVLAVSKETEFNVKTAHKLFWSLYSFAGFLRSIRALHTAAQELKSPKRRRCSAARFRHASLAATKLLLDVVHTVSWLPRGWLWGGRLGAQHASAAATAAGVLGLVLHYHAKRLATNRSPP